MDRKDSVDLIEEVPMDAYLTQTLKSNMVPDADPDVIQIELFRYEPSSLIAASCLPLCVIHLDFGNGVSPECILNSGTQSILMRRDIWEKTGAPLTTNKATIMQSVNEGRDMMMGMIENLVRIGDVKVFLQVHVVKNTPFEILLG